MNNAQKMDEVYAAGYRWFYNPKTCGQLKPWFFLDEHDNRVTFLGQHPTEQEAISKAYEHVLKYGEF